MVSRNVPPRAAVTTIIPAVGGPSRTTFHSSGEKAALVVMPRSYAHLHRCRPMQHLTGRLTGRPPPKGGVAGVAGRGRRAAWAAANAVIAAATDQVRRTLHPPHHPSWGDLRRIAPA